MTNNETVSRMYHQHRMAEAQKLEDAWKARCTALEQGLRILLDACTGGANRAVLEASIKVAGDVLRGRKPKK